MTQPGVQQRAPAPVQRRLLAALAIIAAWFLLIWGIFALPADTEPYVELSATCLIALMGFGLGHLIRGWDRVSRIATALAMVVVGLAAFVVTRG